MSRSRIILALALVLLCGSAVLLTVRNWAGAGVADVKAVPPGHQEIAWLAPATSGDSWERVIAALELLQKESGSVTQLRVDTANAFLPLTADVPEVSLYFNDAPAAKLWIRWYKLSGENTSPRWCERLSRRDRPPLAIIGGDTSDRALVQSRALEALRGAWPGPAPLYLITTATAERYNEGVLQSGEVPHRTWPKLMDAYAKRTFRFCFTNARMAQGVLDFVQHYRLTDPLLDTAILTQSDPYARLGLLSLTGLFRPYYSSTLIWKDDSYSKDLGEIFLDIFAQQARPKSGTFEEFYNNYIDYSVGGFFEPNPSEAQQVGLYLANNSTFRDRPQLLALPTAAQPARRFLRALCRRAPMETRNVVVVSGDAINFNSVCRDRNLAWNIQDLPVPLVFFCHRDPIDAPAGFGVKDARGLPNQTGTQDVLLYRDIAEALIQGAFIRNDIRAGPLASDADTLLNRLRQMRWHKGRVEFFAGEDGELPGVPFFDNEGNRRPGTGEHIVWLRPVFDGNRVLPEAYITIWRASGKDRGETWRTHGSPLHVLYDQPGP